MLILQRKAGESLFIGDEIEVSVLSVGAGRHFLQICKAKIKNCRMWTDLKIF